MFDENEIEKVMEEIKDEVLEDRLCEEEVGDKAKELWKKYLQTKTPEDYFIFSYFNMMNCRVVRDSVRRKHWDFFQGGWMTIPNLIACYIDCDAKIQSRLRMLKYLTVFITPRDNLADTFVSEEIMFISESRHLNAPKYATKTIVEFLHSIVQTDPDSKIGKATAAVLEQHQDFLNKNISTYDPSESFGGYTLPESF